MDFPFPDIKASCPICQKPGCGDWKGYYSRRVFCFVEDLNENVAIHVGRCKTKRKDFSFLPESFIPYRQITKPSLSRFFGSWLKVGGLQKSLDIFPQIDDSWLVSVSTAWEWIRLTLGFCRINLDLLKVPDSQSFILISDLRVFKTADEVSFSNPRASWPGAINQILHPP
jgi:hypothetical protein